MVLSNSSRENALGPRFESPLKIKTSITQKQKYKPQIKSPPVVYFKLLFSTFFSDFTAEINKQFDQLLGARSTQKLVEIHNTHPRATQQGCAKCGGTSPCQWSGYRKKFWKKAEKNSSFTYDSHYALFSLSFYITCWCIPPPVDKYVRIFFKFRMLHKYTDICGSPHPHPHWQKYAKFRIVSIRITMLKSASKSA